MKLLKEHNFNNNKPIIPILIPQFYSTKFSNELIPTMLLENLKRSEFNHIPIFNKTQIKLIVNLIANFDVNIVLTYKDYYDKNKNNYICQPIGNVHHFASLFIYEDNIMKVHVGDKLLDIQQYQEKCKLRPDLALNQFRKMTEKHGIYDFIILSFLCVD